MFAAVGPIELDRARAAEDGYWSISRGPLASLVFLTPLLAIYEAGVLTLGPQAIRNGADLWLRGLLDTLGFGQYFLLPALTIVLLLAWQHLCGLPWRLPLRVTPCMAVECLVLALTLVLLAQLQGVACQAIGIPAREVGVHLATAATATHASTTTAARCVAFLGAGIYEEVLFRLMLLPACVFALARLGLPQGPRVLIAIAVTSLMFALAHYLGPHGDRWQAFSFLFRAVAGAFFAVLFVRRGFGIAAGAHAGYDLLVGLS